MNRIKKGGVAAVMAVSLVGGWEGLQTAAYPDPATRGKPWTICYGHTEGVRPGDRESIAGCRALLVKDLGEYADKLDRCIIAKLTDGQYVAVLSLAYNIGVAGACKSSVVRNLNAGRVREGCDAILLYDRAAGVRMRGLTRRREAERRLCLAG